MLPAGVHPATSAGLRVIFTCAAPGARVATHADATRLSSTIPIRAQGLMAGPLLTDKQVYLTVRTFAAGKHLLQRVINLAAYNWNYRRCLRSVMGRKNNAAPIAVAAV